MIVDLLTGNAHDLDTAGTGWFIGFSDWTLSYGSGLLHVPRDLALSGLCVKWYDHPSGDDSGKKPISEGKTISILVSSDSRFTIDFSESADFDPAATTTAVLRRHGDFAAWGADLYHRWHCQEKSTILTIRWHELSPK
jgi:hypothetical protein